jgi:hypothetical protein
LLERRKKGGCRPGHWTGVARRSSAAGSLSLAQLMSSNRPSSCSTIAVQLSTQSPQFA